MNPIFRQKAAKLVGEIRSKPMAKSIDEDTVTNLTFFLEIALRAIDNLMGEKPVATGDDVLTVGRLTEIMVGIEDPDLRRFFSRKVAEGMKAKAVEPKVIGKTKIERAKDTDDDGA